jgi:pyruvate,orthophosphate dikinase
MILALDALGQTEPYDKNQVGGKASNLHDMILMGLNVPRAFVISTDVCFQSEDKRQVGTSWHMALMSHVRYMAQQTNRVWNGAVDPLVVSVRSGAPVSMPGMMETVLNVGLTRDNLEAFVEARGASRSFGLDCYRRLIQMYGTTVADIPAEKFTSVYNAARVFYEELDERANENLVRLFERVYLEQTGEAFPDDANTQLLGAINAVFRSWNSEKAVTYRKLENIDDKMGTAVTIQEMVFGNLDESSATGVVFTHDPNTGKLGWYGDYLVGAQGEDVVAGTHNTLPIKSILKDPVLSKTGKELQALIGMLWREKKDILDIEFTIQSGRLYILQYRKAKVARQATIKSLLDMTREGTIPVDLASQRMMEMLPSLDLGSSDPGNLCLLGKGLGAVPGVVVGQIAVGREAAALCQRDSIPYVYVAHETAPDDVEQMKDAVGVLTAAGGLVSHAVVVTRGWDIPCVVGFDRIKVGQDGFTFNGEAYSNGSLIKINGSTGEIFA